MKKVITFFLIVVLISCKGKTKETSKNIQNTAKITLEIYQMDEDRVLGYSKKSLFKILKDNEVIDGYEKSIPFNKCNNNEISCGIDYINGSFEIIDLNNDSYKEVLYLFHHYSKTEQLPKNLEAILFDTKKNKRYIINGIGVNEFDELTQENPKGSINETSKDIPSVFAKQLRKKWEQYSFEHKIATVERKNTVQITSSKDNRNISKKSIDKLSSLENTSLVLENLGFTDEEKEFISFSIKEGETLKFKKPAAQSLLI